MTTDAREAESEEVPYPLPDRWPVSESRKPGRWRIVVGVLVAAVLPVRVIIDLQEGHLLRAALLTAGFVMVTAVIAVLRESTGGERGLPHLVNAVALTRAVERPDDSWVHFFREKGPSLWLAAWFSVAGGVGSASVAVLTTAALTTDEAVLLALVVPMGLVTLGLLVAGVVGLVSWWRTRSFGRRSTGLSLGRTGVVRYYMDGTESFAWTDIRAVRATTRAADTRSGWSAPVLRLDTAARRDDMVLDLEGYEACAWLIYAAVRYWAEHPEEREELSSTFAQRRIQRWANALARPSAPS